MSQASPRLQQFKDACLPFVTRTFRGVRLRRYVALSLLLGALSIVMGLWLSFGRGHFEQDVRRGLDLEQASWQLDRAGFNITAHDEWSYQEMKLARAQAVRDGQRSGRSDWLGSEVDQAYTTLYTALSQTPPRGQAGLVAEIEALLDRYPPQALHPEIEGVTERQDYDFNWYSPQSRQRLRAIVDADLLPTITYYTSPLTATDGVRVTGFIAGGFVVLLMLIAAPLVTGASLAQEVHENTLQPILGTRLRAVDIVLGLTASGLALAGVLAAPSLAVMLVAAVLGGHTAVLPVFLLLLGSATVVLTMLTQLLGYGLGRRWTSGLVGTALTGALCVLMMLAAAVGLQLEDETMGLVAVLPQAGPLHLLRELFAPSGSLAGPDVHWAVLVQVFSVAAFAALAFLMSRALTRRVAGLTQASLTRVEGAVAAFIVMLMAIAAIPEHSSRDAVPVYFVTLGLAVLPWQIILMGRVPIGDGPSKLRTVPLSRLLLEFGGFAAAHLVVVLLIVGPNISVSAIGTFHLVWALAVVALVAVRAVAVELRIASSLWVTFCLAAAGFGLVQAGIFTASASDAFYGHAPAPLVMFEVSPLLGVLQIVLIAWIPTSLIRALRRSTAGMV